MICRNESGRRCSSLYAGTTIERNGESGWTFTMNSSFFVLRAQRAQHSTKGHCLGGTGQKAIFLNLRILCALGGESRFLIKCSRKLRRGGGGKAMRTLAQESRQRPQAVELAAQPRARGRLANVPERFERIADLRAQ